MVSFILIKFLKFLIKNVNLKLFHSCFFIWWRPFLIVVVICIFLIPSDAEHLLIWLWALCMSFFEKCLLRFIACFVIRLFVFLLLSCMSSLYILEIKPLSNISLAYMFSHTVCSFFILLMVSLAVQKLFNLM